MEGCLPSCDGTSESGLQGSICSCKHILRRSAVLPAPCMVPNVLQSFFWGLPKWVLPKIRGTFLGVPIIMNIIVLGLYWATLILGDYQMVRP